MVIVTTVSGMEEMPAPNLRKEAMAMKPLHVV